MSADATVSAAVDLDDESYDSAEDEDFKLDGAQDESDLSSDDQEDGEPVKKKRKSNKKAEIPQEDELDSGDEATIRKAREKREKKRKGKKSKGKQADEDDDMDWDDEGGTGGFVRTRAMKQHIQEERKPLAKIDGATVDVDALWEQMNAPGSKLGLQPNQIKNDSEPAPEADRAADDVNAKDHATKEPENDSHNAHEQMIKIKRTYKFAGEMITEEKVVPKNSAEAKAFLSSGENAEFAVEDTGANLNLRRPLRKISRFDPNPTGTIKKSWEKQPIEAGGDQNAAGPKINTVEKSRLDWAQYVDQAGIQDELRVHSRAKEGYMGRMDFLGRMEAKRDEEARQARLKGM